MDHIKVLGRRLNGAAGLLLLSLLVGCAGAGDTYNWDPLTNNSSPAGPPTAVILNAGDKLTVTFNDLSNPIPPDDVQIKEDGTITLIYNKTFQAAGRTVGELEADIRTNYVPSYFRNMTPTVRIQDRYYYVGGEVRSPNRYPYVSTIKVLGAIDSAGGFTDFARRSRVLIIRANGKRSETIDATRALKDPKLNLEIFPGDKIQVPKAPI